MQDHKHNKAKWFHWERKAAWQVCKHANRTKYNGVVCFCVQQNLIVVLQ
jgi:hypothetical protein